MKIQDTIMNEIIKDYKSGMSPNKLSEIYTDYSPYVIRENLRELGILRNKFYSEKELEAIIFDYKNEISIDNIAMKYNRDKDALISKLKKEKVYENIKKTTKPYTNEEIEIIKKYYPFGDWESLLGKLPNRDKNSIISKAWKLGIKNESFYWTQEKIENILKDKGYRLLTEFKGITEKHELTDKDGYLFYTSLGSLIYSENPQLLIVSFRDNPTHSLENIKRYIVVNELNCELLSTEYINSSELLLWRCKCGEVFECSWNDFQQGKHWCNKCADRIIADKNSYSLEDVKELIKDRPFHIIDDTFTRLSYGCEAYTNDGYHVLLNNDNITKNQEPEIFHPLNPYTIDNIWHYIELHNITTKLLSGTYVSNTDLLDWKCSCGDNFKRSWSGFSNGAILCNKCSLELQGLNKRIPKSEIVTCLNSNGYTLLSDDIDSLFANSLYPVVDQDGYKYNVRYHSIKNGKTPEKFYPTNPYSIENINTFLKMERNEEYICIEDVYLSNDVDMKFLHIPCGTIFTATLIEMQGRYSQNGIDKYYKQCPKCNTYKTESIHASVLKQVFLHECPDTDVEERSCINPNTGRALPTDIVNHRLKLVVEVQSAYHDNPYKQELDVIKKEFWVNKGYNFYAPDIRDYSILQMIQLFFEDIKEIPEYIDYKFGNCIDYVPVQELLDKGFSISEISNMLDIKAGSIRGLLKNKKISLPDGYKEKVYNIKKIVRLSKDNKLIKTYNTLSSIEKDGYALGTVKRVLKGIQKFAYDTYWTYEDDYLSGNYNIPKTDFDYYTLPVDKYDMNNNYVKSYGSIYEAEKDSASSRSEIYRVANGNRNSSRKEKWKFKNVA